jgi:hypothetical protein
MLMQNWKEVNGRDFTRGRQRDSRCEPSQIVCNFISKDARLTGHPEEFYIKVILIKREKNTLYAEDKWRETRIERIAN